MTFGLVKCEHKVLAAETDQIHRIASQCLGVRDRAIWSGRKAK